MTYVLLALTQSDREKILEDGATNQGKLRWLEQAMRSGVFQETWALDRQHNNYLFSVPMQIREEWDRQPYCAFIDGQMYRLASVGFFPSAIYFDEDALPSTADVTKVQNEVRAALAVYGWRGRGPHDDFGDPSLFGPKFVKRMPLDSM
ncbi:MAG: hypothetical protein WKG03_08210 [Telluria sp.]